MDQVVKHFSKIDQRKKEIRINSFCEKTRFLAEFQTFLIAYIYTIVFSFDFIICHDDDTPHKEEHVDLYHPPHIDQTQHPYKEDEVIHIFSLMLKMTMTVKKYINVPYVLVEQVEWRHYIQKIRRYFLMNLVV